MFYLATSLIQTNQWLYQTSFIAAARASASMTLSTGTVCLARLQDSGSSQAISKTAISLLTSVLYRDSFAILSTSFVPQELQISL